MALGFRPIPLAAAGGGAAPFVAVDAPPPRARIDLTYTRQFVSAGLALLTAVALPAGKAQVEPTDYRLDPKIARNWTPTNDLARRLAVTLPFSRSDWPLANPFRKVDSPIARDRQRVNDLARQTAVTLPAQLKDFPIPARVDSPLARDRQRINDLPRQLESHPFYLDDWPLADRRDSPLTRDRQRINDLANQTAVTLPKQPFDWPTAKLPRDPRQARDWTPTNDLARATAVTLPFGLTEWPLPLRADSPLARDRQRLNDLGRQTAVRLPAQPYDWPISRLGRPAPAATAYVNVVPVNTPVVVVVAPFGNLNWPLAALTPPGVPGTQPLGTPYPALNPEWEIRPGWIPRHRRRESLEVLTDAIRDALQQRPQPVVQRTQVFEGAGAVASAEAFGRPRATLEELVFRALSISSAEQFGDLSWEMTLSVEGILSAEEVLAIDVVNLHDEARDALEALRLVLEDLNRRDLGLFL